MPRLQYLRIPNELTALNQWAVAALPDKAPRHPVTGRLLKTTEPNTWASFESVLNSGYPAIGFLLTKDDPYTVIDLDVKESHPPEVQARHDKIYAAFDTYAERSVSGVGRHIICRGKIHGGLHRDYVEVYDQERFILCTGAVLRPAPITEQGPLLARLVQEMGGITNTVRISASEPEQYSDDEILRKLGHARNADKFKDLYYRAPFTGEDWSQRDASLAQLLVFYSRNHEQLLRLFRGSKLYRPHDKYPSPERYENDYLLRRTFGKAIDHYNREAAEEVANIEHGQQIAQQLLSKVHTPADTPTEEPAVTFPPGLIGDVAQFILSAAERPVKEVALAGSLVFCAGLFGRQYNISNTGLNLYLVLLAKTGRGKEAASAGINKLMTALRSHVPGIDNYRGPGHIASGQGLIRHLNENQSCFSLLSEFGHSLKIITDARASAADARTKAVFLDLFTKSGKGDALLGSAYSDSAKNTHTVQAPAFSFLGDSTPATYYSVIDERLVDEGLIPRFLTIAYMGPRQAPNPAVTATPSDELVTRLVASAQSIMNMQHSHIFVDVPCTPEAQRMLNDFNLYCDRHINQDSGAVEIWNRAHLENAPTVRTGRYWKGHAYPRGDPGRCRLGQGVGAARVALL